MIQDVKKIYLCDLNLNPITQLNGVQTDTVNASRLVKDVGILTFDVDEYISINGEKIKSNGYDELDIYMILYLEDFGMYQLQKPTESGDGQKHIKSIVAYSLEKEFKDKNWINFKVNTGAKDSLEQLATGNLNDMGFAKEFVSFYNPDNKELSFIDLVLEYMPAWSYDPEDIDVLLVKKKMPAIEEKNISLYALLTSRVAPRMECLFLFDTIHRKIKVVAKENLNDKKYESTVFIGYRNLATTVLASFAANQIDLGKNNTNAIINLCGATGKISSYIDPDFSNQQGIKIDSTMIDINGNDSVTLNSIKSDRYATIGLSTWYTSNSIELSCLNTGSNKSVSMDMAADNNLSPYIRLKLYEGNTENYVNIKPSYTEFLNRIESNANIHTYSDLKADGLVYAANGFYRNGVTEILYNKLLWSGEWWPLSSHTCNFQESVSSQPHGILLVFSGYNSGTINADWNTFFVSKREIAEWPGGGHGFLMSSTNLNRVCQKYLYINDTYLRGHDQNNQTGTGSSGASYTNNAFVLRYIFGV